MNTWTAEVNGAEALCRLGPRQSAEQLVSRGGGFEFAAPALGFDAEPVMAPRCARGDPQNGVPVFRGRVAQVPRFAVEQPGTALRRGERVGSLEQLVYQQNWYLQVDPEPLRKPCGRPPEPRDPLPRVNGSKGLRRGSKSPTPSDTLPPAGGHRVARTWSSTSCQRPFDEGLDMICSEVIQKALKWAPDAVTWFDTHRPSNVHAARRTQLRPFL